MIRTVGRTYPRQSPYRSAPFDPAAEGQGDGDRIAPLPFQNIQAGGGSVTSPYTYKQIFQTVVTKVSSGGGAAVTIGGCSTTDNLFCVPTATISIATRPTASIRCSIT